MRKKIILAGILAIPTIIVSAGCAETSSMAKDFPCSYSVQYEPDNHFYTTNLEDVGLSTYPQWYSGFAVNPGKYRQEWQRLILARNGLTSEEQVVAGMVLQIPSRCSDVADQPQSK